METKPRILYLKKILEERTDEEHPLSTTQLINILADEYGISAHRTTVSKDIAALQEFGMDIVIIQRKLERPVQLPYGREIYEFHMVEPYMKDEKPGPNVLEMGRSRVTYE